MPKFSHGGQPPLALQAAMHAQRQPRGGHWTETSHLCATVPPRASAPRRGGRASWRPGLLLAAALGLGASAGHASSAAAPDPVATRLHHKRVLPYPRPDVWPASIRYLRVERGYEIVDRDPEIGYVLFEFSLEGGSKGRGSIELVDTTDVSGRAGVALDVSTEAGPTHLPHAIAEGIAKKVRDERGPPAAPPKAPAPPAEPPAEPDESDDPLVLHPNGPGEGG
jgi:hypothetical protein